MVRSLFRPAPQSVDLLRLSFIFVLLVVMMVSEAAWSDAEVDSCYEVKMAYMMRQIGAAELVPDRPGTGESLRVCMHAGPSCCTSKMEDSYVAAVRSETQQKMRSYSFELKYLITGHTRAYRETFDSLVSFTSNLTSTLFDDVYAPLATDCRPLVSRLFDDIRLHLSGDPDASLDHAVHRFYNNLFPLVYRRLLNPGIGQHRPLRDPPFHFSSSTGDRDDCLRLTRQDVSPFGPHPRLLAGSLARALATGRAMNRLLRLAGEAVNATEKVALSRECVQGLVRMQYCSHCRGLTLIRPCTGLCVNVMRGCLVGVSELGSPWGSLVVLLQRLAALLATSSGHHSMELALLAVRNHVNDAILHSQLHGPRITATVEKVCGPLEPSATVSALNPVTSVTSVTPATTSVTFGTSSMSPPTPPSPAALQEFQSQSRRSLPLKGSTADKPRSLKKLSREFQGSIQRYQGFLSELPEMLCESEMEVEQHTCWSGEDVVESYVGHVVGSSLKAQRENPEMTVRNTDHVLKGVKRRLEQLLKELHADLGWEDLARQNKEEEEGGSGQRETGSGEDCDDEDGCEGSGGMDGEGESGGVSSGRGPAVKGVPPLRHPVTTRRPPPPQVAVRASAQTMASSHLSPLSLTSLLLLFLLLAPWEPL